MLVVDKYALVWANNAANNILDGSARFRQLTLASLDNLVMSGHMGLEFAVFFKVCCALCVSTNWLAFCQVSSDVDRRLAEC